MAPFIQTNTKNSIIFKILSTRSLHLVHSRHAFSIAHQMNKVCHYVERLQFLNPVEHLNLSVCSYGWTPNRHVIKVWTYAQNTSRSLDSIVTTIWSPFLFAKHHFDILQIFLYRLHSWNIKCQSTQLLTAWGHSQFKPTDKTTCGVTAYLSTVTSQSNPASRCIRKHSANAYCVRESTIFSSDVILRPSKRGMCWQVQKSLPTLTSHTCSVRQMPLPVLWFLNGADFCLYLFRRYHAPLPYQIAGGKRMQIASKTTNHTY